MPIREVYYIAMGNCTQETCAQSKKTAGLKLYVRNFGFGLFGGLEIQHGLYAGLAAEKRAIGLKGRPSYNI